MMIVMGMEVTGYFTPRHSFLVAGESESAKVIHARKWNIPIVSHYWVEDCMSYWRLCPVSDNGSYIQLRPLGQAMSIENSPSSDNRELKQELLPVSKLVVFRASLITLCVRSRFMFMQFVDSASRRLKRCTAPRVMFTNIPNAQDYLEVRDMPFLLRSALICFVYKVILYFEF